MREIMRAPHGAELYGLLRPESDRDYKGIFVPNMDDHLLTTAPKEISRSTSNSQVKNTAKDTDVNLFRLDYFIELARRGDATAIDMLHTPKEMLIATSQEWKFIRRHRSRFYTKNMTALVEYARHQAAKYGVKGSRMAALEEVYNVTCSPSVRNLCTSSAGWKLEHIWEKLPLNEFCRIIVIPQEGKPDQVFYEALGSKFQDRMPLIAFVGTIEIKWNQYGERARLAKENKGVDWKALSHACRAAYQLNDILSKGDLIYPFTGDRQKFLMDVKQGKLDFLMEVQPELEKAIGEVEVLLHNSILPDEVDTDFWKDFILEVYREEVRGLI